MDQPPLTSHLELLMREAAGQNPLDAHADKAARFVDNKLGDRAAQFVEARPKFTDVETIIKDILTVAQSETPGAHLGVIEAVARKVAATEPNYPFWWDDTLFSGRAKAEYRCLSLHGAIDILKGKLGWMAAVAQMAQARIDEKNLTSQDLLSTMIEAVEKTNSAPITREELSELHETIELTEQVARIRRQPFVDQGRYYIADLSPKLDELMEILKSGRQNDPTAEYRANKELYLKQEKSNLGFYDGGEAFILNSKYRGLTYMLRLRDTLDLMHWWLTKNLPPKSLPAIVARLTAQNAMGMYVPVLDDANWSEALKRVGFVIAQTLDFGGITRIKDALDAVPSSVADRVSAQLVKLVANDPFLISLNTFGIEAEFESRKKTEFSVWRRLPQKCLERDEYIEPHELKDVFGIRFRFKQTLSAGVAALSKEQLAEMTEPACRRVLELITAHSGVKKDGEIPYILYEAKDYIGAPKANGYKSIHGAIRALPSPETGALPIHIEFHVDTVLMDEENRRGAPHWEHARDKIRNPQALIGPPQYTIRAASSEIGSRRQIPQEIKKELGAYRPLLSQDIDSLLKGKGSAKLPESTLSTWRTPLGTVYHIPSKLPFLDQLYLFTRATRRDFFSCISDVEIDGVPVKITEDFLRSSIPNGASVNFKTAFPIFFDSKWARHKDIEAHDWNLKKWFEVVELVDTRRVVKEMWETSMPADVLAKRSKEKETDKPKEPKKQNRNKKGKQPSPGGAGNGG